MIDLGKWADDSYRVPTKDAPPDPAKDD